MFSKLTIKAHLSWLIGLMTVIMVFLTSFNLYQLIQAKRSLETVYFDRAIPLGDLNQIQRMLFENRLVIVNNFISTENANNAKTIISNNLEEISKLLNKYADSNLTAEEKNLSTKLIEDRDRFVNEGLKPALQLIEIGDKEKLAKHIAEHISPLFIPVAKSSHALIEVHQNVTKYEYESVNARYEQALTVSIISIIGAVGLSLFMSISTIRRLFDKLGGEPNYTVSIVNAIANGNLSVEVKLEKNDRTSLLYSVNEMRKMLKAIISETNFVMKNAVHGQLSSRIQIEAKGDFSLLKESINQSLDNIDETLTDVVKIAHALADGNLDQQIDKEYAGGVFEETKQAINKTANAINDIIKEIDNVINSGVASGDFRARMQLDNKVGYGIRLAELINQLFETTESNLMEIMIIAEALAFGDLTQNVNGNYTGAFEVTKTAMNSTVETLKYLIDKLKVTSQTIRNTSLEVSEENNDLLEKISGQVRWLQYTARNIEKLSNIVQNNANKAKTASDLAVDASHTTKNGVKVVNNVIATMESISESSNKIVDIVTVIDDIAFRTNILALNAAVEAARAGKQGEGFAIVAVEVRTLSQRVAKAAGEVRKLITDSVEQISDGSREVKQAGQTMEKIVESIQQVTGIMSDIAGASHQQNEEIIGLHRSITEMNDTAEQNALLLRKATSAVQFLNSETDALITEMSHFKTSKDNQLLDFQLF